MAQSAILSGNEITDIVRLTGIQGDGRAAPDYSIGSWPPTTNLCPNGGFETGMGQGANWYDNGSGATLIRDSTTAKFGTASLLLTKATGGPAASMGTSATVTASVPYTVSMWVKGIAGEFVNCTYIERTAADVFVANHATIYTLTGDWQRIITTITPGVGNTKARVALSTSAGVTSLSVDGVQLEQKLVATPYVHTDGAAASRGAPRTQISASFLDETQSWVALRGRMGWKATDDIYFPNLACFWEWGDDVNNRFALGATGNTGRLRVQRRTTAGIQDSSGTGPVAWVNADDVFTAIFAWTATTLYVSANGNAFVTVAGTPFVPTLAATLFDVGDGFVNNAFQPIAGDIFWLIGGTGIIIPSDIASINLPNLVDRSKGTVQGLATLLSAGAAPTILAPMIDGRYNYDTPTMPTGLIRV